MKITFKIFRNVYSYLVDCIWKLNFNLFKVKSLRKLLASERLQKLLRYRLLSFKSGDVIIIPSGDFPPLLRYISSIPLSLCQTRFLLISMHWWASFSWTQIVLKVNFSRLEKVNFVRQFRVGLDINLIRGNRSGRFKNPPPPPAHFLIEKLSLWFITYVNNQR